ncbi:phosphopantothenoylcysteine decarboxylase [Angomonas deanei]|nr:phosphopantothenoylcysteine decarboxylase [Angomonas deanei]|eukprot:EPY32835.1 phosphopantothenoylcysteine decarboxylase [Angomonas deanei]
MYPRKRTAPTMVTLPTNTDEDTPAVEEQAPPPKEENVTEQKQQENAKDEVIAPNLLLLVTGSVAAIKLGLFLDAIADEACHVRMVTTKTALYFLQRAAPSKTGIPFQSIISDEAEWASWNTPGDSVLHIDLREWADLVVVLPLDANSLAKISLGLCDNLVSCILRAWRVRERPVLVCPAMNTAMWDHPVTGTQLHTLQSWYSHHKGEEIHTAAPDRLPSSYEDSLFQVVGPVTKRLACGDVGNGGMAAVDDIATVVRHTLQLVREYKRMKTVAAGEKEV